MPDTETMSDDPARRAVRGALDETMFVEAGAGTGKTTELVNRVLALVESGKSKITDVAAITFTEAAAADLRGRVHAELVRRASLPDDRWAREALGGLDEASMSTIHGFAQRILAEHPLAAGLPLRFRVFDEIESQLEYERRFAATIESFVADDDDADLVAAARAVGVSMEALESLAFEIDDSWDRFRVQREINLSRDDIRAAVDSTTQVIADAMSRILSVRDQCDDDTDRLVVAIDGVEEWLTRLPHDADWIDRLEWCCRVPGFGGTRVGKKENWSRIDVDAARAEIAVAERVRQEGVSRLNALILDAVVERFAAEAARSAEVRRKAGELRFHDLLVFARDLVSSNAEVARSVSERYRYILVDEFQDTDPLQLEIVKLIAKDPSSGAPVPGKLFFVGDPRQSIYRFRGAEPELYESALRELVASGPAQLTRNFRSVGGIIDFVNGVFSRLFTTAGDPPHQARYAPLEADCATKGVDPVTILGVNAPEKLKALERRAREANEIAEVIATAVRDAWRVRTPQGDRAAGFGDIVILVTRRTGLAQLEAALDAHDIPFRADSPSLILRSSEVRDLLSCLRAVDSPGDEAALVAALRTSLLAVGDDDLVRFRRRGGAWRLDLGPGEDRSDPVVVAIDRLSAIAERRYRLGVVGTLDAVARDLCAFELAATTRHAEESLRRLDYLVSRANAYVESGATTIAGFLAWIEGQLHSRIRSAETAVGDGDDSVRILTVHTAKGLEFPIVVLAELGSEPARQRPSKMLLFSEEGRPEVRVRQGVETKGSAALFDAETREDDRESLRLCYVGMTRAKDRLVVSLHRSAGTPTRPSLAERVASVLEDVPETWRETKLTEGEPGTGRILPRAPFAGPAATRAGLEDWNDRRAALVSRSARRSSVGASELDELFGVARPGGRNAATDVAGHDDAAKWRSPRSASAVGRAVHGVLQRVDLATGEDLDALVRLESDREGCVDEVEQVARLVRAALASAPVRDAVRSSVLWRELPVSVPVGVGVLDAVVDLAYDDDGRLVVVDYKTDALKDASGAGDAAARYRLQAGAYVLALDAALGRTVDRFTLLFLGVETGAVGVDVFDLAGAARDAADRIAAVFAGAPS